ncbi:MAG: TonB-dependent receptor [Phenylobacterium sp.]|uniref:TonB-dependent receptor n=1 Tax=Phenylobacterium sp. TaxID=1871053 RepID=UPI001A36E9BB|nr:TonB-dependent receptor [Phenylobacterium sp.]MBL8555451.1 TonB-dependent receptor [Phenylobacterium sp.]
MKALQLSTVSSVVLLSLGVGAPAFAADESASAAVEEVIVTAQKTSQNLQQVPLAVTGLTGDFVEKSKIENFLDLRTRIPSLTFDEFAPGQPRYFIRGIGNTNRSGGIDSAVGLFVDDVYMGRPAMTSTEFVDLDRVEVLRGPQGTLFGRNVVGGAVSFFTRRPGDSYRFDGKVTAGNYDLRAVSAAVSGPLSDTTSAKIALVARSHDGYAFNTTTGRDIEDERVIAGRAAIRFRPNDDLDIQLNLDGSQRRGTGPWWDLAVEGPASVGKSNPDPRRGRGHAEDGYADIDNAGASLNATWDSPLGTLTSISAYRNAQNHNRANTTGLLVAPLSDVANRRVFHHTLFIQQDDESTEQFTQEFRLASNIGENFSYVAGLYYYQDDVFHNRLTDYRFYNFGANPLDGRFNFASTNETKAYAVFLNGIYEVTDRLKVQAGIRWSQDEKDHVTVGSGANFSRFRNAGVTIPGYTAPGRAKWDAWTPTASVNYQVTDDAFVYATISRGFKSGGFNDTDNDLQSALRPFNPEYVWNYEFGARTEWFDRRLRLNATAFYMDYTDLQVTVITTVTPGLPPTGVSGNAGKSTIKGLELEWTAVPLPGLNIYGNYTYTDGKIKSLVSGTLNLAGKEIPRAPKNKLFLGASLTRDLGPVTVTGRVDYSHQSDFFSSINNLPSEVIPSQENWDAGLTLTPAGKPYSVEIWGKNLSNELKITTISDVTGDGYALYAPPRTYGVTLSVRY